MRSPRLLALLSILGFPLALSAAEPPEVDGKSYDLVVVGGTPGGIACAVRAAREGLTVLLVNHTQHLGGFVTSGAGGWEAPYDGLRSPLYGEMRTKAAEFYAQTYGAGSPQHLLSMPSTKSNAHIDRAKLEPRVAEMLFDQMCAREKSLTVLKGFYITTAQRDGALLKSIALHELKGPRTCQVVGKIFADGMYEADLVAAAKVPSIVGREARSQYDEPHAGQVTVEERAKEPGQRGFPKDADEGRLKIRYNSHATGAVSPGSTGAADQAVMAYNYRTILTRVPENRVMVEKPANYDEAIAKSAANGGFVPNLPNGKVAWNGARLIGPQNGYPEGDWAARERISQQYLDAMLMALWYMQNDPGAPAKMRAEFKDYGLAKDEFVDNQHLPYEIYVREARRLVGRQVFTEHDNLLPEGLGRTPIHADSVAITDWPVDSVACTKIGGKTNGIFFLGEESRPAQVPYATLLAQGLDNLLVPVALSASHVGWGSIRLEPVWMQTGEAAGFAAALALKNKTTPAQLEPDLLLRTLVESKCMVSFFNDVDVTGGEPWIAAVEFLGAKGFFRDYDARSLASLDAATAAAWAHNFARLANKEAGWDPVAEARQVPAGVPAEAPGLTGQEFVQRLNAAGAPGTLVDAGVKASGVRLDAPISRGEACRLMYLGLPKP